MLELILKKVRVLIASNPSFSSLSDELLMLYVEQAYHEALGYCNVAELPETAAGAVAFLVLDLLSVNLGGQNISSLSEGGRSVQFESGTQAAALIKPEHRKALDRYKAVRCV